MSVYVATRKDLAISTANDMIQRTATASECYALAMTYPQSVLLGVLDLNGVTPDMDSPRKATLATLLTAERFGL